MVPLLLLRFWDAGVSTSYSSISQMITIDLLIFADIVNECDSAPCGHGGTCKDLLGRFECDCSIDYSGRQCELGN